METNEDVLSYIVIVNVDGVPYQDKFYSILCVCPVLYFHFTLLKTDRDKNVTYIPSNHWHSVNLYICVCLLVWEFHGKR